jgi:hypothetical protein
MVRRLGSVPLLVVSVSVRSLVLRGDPLRNSPYHFADSFGVRFCVSKWTRARASACTQNPTRSYRAETTRSSHARRLLSYRQEKGGNAAKQYQRFVYPVHCSETQSVASIVVGAKESQESYPKIILYTPCTRD